MSKSEDSGTGVTSKTSESECSVCGDTARYAYFGAISCSSCKMFFRRNANVPQSSFVCPFGGHCQINTDARQQCTACRLAKCFQCGMTTDRFRATGSAASKKKSSEVTQWLPTLNLLKTDQSCLTNEEWTELTNLYHAFQESELLSTIECLVSPDNISQLNDAGYQTLVERFIASAYETTGLYIRSNNDLGTLPSNDRSIMLRNAADNVACISGAFFIYFYQLYSINAFTTTIATFYGQKSIDIQRWMERFVDSDIVVIKLTFSLFAFTINTWNYSPKFSTEVLNPIAIFNIQNRYAVIIWKYLFYRYGYDQAVKRFLKLTSWLVAATVFMHYTQSLPSHIESVHSLAEEIELTFVLDDAQHILQTCQ